MKDAMTCEAFEGLLPRHLEGETGADERPALEAHAASCAGCGAMLAELREVTRQAAALPVLVPSRDLWEGIAARIDSPAIPLDSRRIVAPPAAEGHPRSWRAAGLAAAAAVLMAATAGITSVVTRQMVARQYAQDAMVDVMPAVDASPASGGILPEATEPSSLAMTDTATSGTTGSTPPGRAAGRQARPGIAPAAATGATGMPVANRAPAEAVYDREIAVLQEMLDQRRAELDPATTVVIEGNLRIIDRAIRDSRAALARDPASGFLSEQLTMALDKKLQLMRTAAKLPSRT